VDGFETLLTSVAGVATCRHDSASGGTESRAAPKVASRFGLFTAIFL
jgi:hypothetical protein